jgi:uncharacterized protein Yka (UPF0111/DUF47 family)
MNNNIKKMIVDCIDECIGDLVQSILVLKVNDIEKEKYLDMIQDYCESAADNCNGGNKRTVRRALKKRFITKLSKEEVKEFNNSFVKKY